MIVLTENQLRSIMPICMRPAEWTIHLNRTFDVYRINRDRDHVCVFLAQVAVESSELNRLVENMNYSAEGLLKTWPSRFTPEKAQAYARQPERIANYVYANRLGNGDEASGDGWRHRGMGIIQTTGKDNQTRALKELGLQPHEFDKLRVPEYAALSAGAYWARKPQLALLADDLPNDDDDADFLSGTRIVNGGTIGLAERRRYWTRAKAVIK